MASINIETKDSVIWSDEMDFDTYGIVLDGPYTNSFIYKASNYKGDFFMYIISETGSNRIFLNAISSGNFRCHVKPLAAGSKITITI